MTSRGREPGRRHTNAWFVTTHWSQVQAAGSGDTKALSALSQVCTTYWFPIYAYVRRRGYSPQDAQDLTQEFFAHLLHQERLRKADQRRGRFRSFLLSSLNHFLADEWDKSQALKRGGGTRVVDLDSAEARYCGDPVENHTPEQIFEQRWALGLLHDVLERLRAEYVAQHKSELFNALSPCLVGDRSDQPYGELGRTMNLSESAVKSAVHRLRGRYRSLLREAIGQTVSSVDEVDDELNYLFAVLAKR